VVCAIFLFAFIIVGILFRNVSANVRSFVRRLFLPYSVQSQEINPSGALDANIPDSNIKEQPGSTVGFAGFLRLYLPAVRVPTSFVTLIVFLGYFHNTVASAAQLLRAFSMVACCVGSSLRQTRVFISTFLLSPAETIFFAEQTQQRLRNVYRTFIQCISVVSITGGFVLRTSAAYSDSLLTGSSTWAPVNAIGDGRAPADMLLDSGAAISLMYVDYARKLRIDWVETYGATQALLPNNAVIPEIGRGTYRGITIHIFDKIPKSIAALSDFLVEGSGRRAVYNERNAWVE